MKVLDRPEEPSRAKTSPAPGDPLMGGGGWWVRGKESKLGFFAGRFAFVIVGTMLAVATLISFFMLWVSWNEPYLQPNILDDTLHVGKIYLQYDGETVYHELAMGNQPIDLTNAEVTQIPVNRNFKIIFTPKQLDIPEKYQIYLKEGSKEPEGGLTRQSKYLKGTVDGNYYSLTVAPVAGKWSSGRYEVVLPDSGMFGGKWFAYFVVSE